MAERKFKLNCLSITAGSNNLVYRGVGTEIPESAFAEGQADEYLKSGHIVEVTEGKNKKSKKSAKQPDTDSGEKLGEKSAKEQAGESAGTKDATDSGSTHS